VILPNKYLDKTSGVRPAPMEPSFNNIIYTAWYHIARKEQGNFSQADMVALEKHIALNQDPDGLYKPKNSHDNITYKIILSKVFKLDCEPHMNFLAAVKSIGFFRIWDVITYGAVFGPKYLRWFFRILLFIPALQMIQAVHNKGKIRPTLFDKGVGRFPWWFLPKKLIKEEFVEANQITYKYWDCYDGEERVTRHMQNDGKHLAVFRLYAFKDFFWFKLANKVCKKMLIKRYGQDYTYGIVNRYFRDRKHPLIAMWKGHGDIL
jgi:hypothetical protein